MEDENETTVSIFIILIFLYSIPISLLRFASFHFHWIIITKQRIQSCFRSGLYLDKNKLAKCESDSYLLYRGFRSLYPPKYLRYQICSYLPLIERECGVKMENKARDVRWKHCRHVRKFENVNSLSGSIRIYSVWLDSAVRRP